MVLFHIKFPYLSVLVMSGRPDPKLVTIMKLPSVNCSRNTDDAVESVGYVLIKEAEFCDTDIFLQDMNWHIKSTHNIQ